MFPVIRFTLSFALLAGLCITGSNTLAADRETRDAAIGGGVGGAIGGAVGEDIGGREGAIIGAATGAAIGAALATDSDSGRDVPAPRPPRAVVIVTEEGHHHGHGRHCPPGQAKKGRC